MEQDMNYEMIREELGHIRRTLQIDEYQALDVHNKADQAQRQQESDWEEDVYFCPYCGDEKNDQFFSCCGEANHGITMKRAQVKYMDDTGCHFEQAMEFTGEQT
jgi:hypothetical protein